MALTELGRIASHDRFDRRAVASASECRSQAWSTDELVPENRKGGCMAGGMVFAQTCGVTCVGARGRLLMIGLYR